MKAPEETAEQRLRERPVLITRGTTDSNKTDKAWGMHCLHQEQKVCAPIRSHHSWLVRRKLQSENRKMVTRLPSVVSAIPLLAIPTGEQTIAIRMSLPLFPCFGFTEDEAKKILRQKIMS